MKSLGRGHCLLGACSVSAAVFMVACAVISVRPPLAVKEFGIL